MTDLTPAADVATEPDGSQSTGYTQEQMTAVREEAKAYRLQSKSLQTQIDQYVADTEAAATAALAEQGEYKTLSEQQAATIAELTPFKAEVTAFIEAATVSNAEFVESVDEDKRWSIPTTLDPLALQQWITSNRDKVIGQSYTPPSTNGGAGTNQRPVSDATRQAELVKRNKDTGNYRRI